MLLQPFLLDRWLNHYQFAPEPIRYDLAASTGPEWTLEELAALGGGLDLDRLAATRLGYAPPEGSLEIRSAVAAFYEVDPDWVVVTTGASEALSILFCLASRPGASIVLPQPGFSPFEVVAKAWGLRVNYYRLSSKKGFSQTAEDLLAAVDSETVLALVNTPHNPTGSVMPHSELERLALELRSHGIGLIVDEVYHPLYFGDAQKSAATIAGATTISDMSKALSLPGMRIGWLIEPDPEQRSRIIDARGYFTISGSPLLEMLAAHALRHHSVLLDKLATVSKSNLNSLRKFMETHSAVLSWHPPLGGTVSFPGFQDGRDARPFCIASAERGVLLAPGDCFEAPAHFRIGVGAQSEGFDSALSLLGEVLESGRV